MSDRIIDIGRGGLETTDKKVRAMMNNVVNAQTPGFQKSDVTIKGFPNALEKATSLIEKRTGYQSMMPQAAGVYHDTTHGPLFKTGSSTDVAIGGDGYFVLGGAEGEVYTRDGRFRLDSNGNLVSSSGEYIVMGQNGPINIIPGARLEITKNGNVMVDDVMVDKLRLVVFNDPSGLESLNGSFYRLSTEKNVSYVEEPNPRILQGYVESSNVSIMDEMMNMIYLERQYTLMTKIIQTRDTSMTRALEMGRPSQ